MEGVPPGGVLFAKIGHRTYLQNPVLPANKCGDPFFPMNPVLVCFRRHVMLMSYEPARPKPTLEEENPRGVSSSRVGLGPGGKQPGATPGTGQEAARNQPGTTPGTSQEPPPGANARNQPSPTTGTSATRHRSQNCLARSDSQGRRRAKNRPPEKLETPARAIRRGRNATVPGRFAENLPRARRRVSTRKTTPRNGPKNESRESPPKTRPKGLREAQKCEKAKF